MSFNLNRINNQINKKIITINSSVNVNNAKASVGSTGVTTMANFNSLSLNNAQLPVTANQINSLPTNTSGMAESSKVLITNSSNDISNINSISCNSLVVDGKNITADMFSSASSNDVNNPYLTNLNSGIATPLKGLITSNNTNSISNINTTSLKTININNVIIKSNDQNNNKLIKNFDDIYPDIYNRFIDPTTSIQNYTQIYQTAMGNAQNQFNNYYWPSICWSSDLGIFVTVSNGTASTAITTNRVMTSKDGINWYLQTAINENWIDVIWIGKLKLFVAVSTSGINNQIMTSPNGIDWTSRVTPTSNYSYKALAWSDELNICVAVGQSNNTILISNDCINWSMTYTNYPHSLIAVCWSPELSMFLALGSGQYSSYYRIYVSYDGITWNSIPFIQSSYYYYSICWSSYYNMFLISATGVGVMYSYDGYTWFYGSAPNYYKTLLWIDEIKYFVGMVDNGYIYFSKSGIQTWSSYVIDGSTTSYVGKLAWSPELGIIISAMAQGYYGGATGKRMYVVNPPYVGKSPSLIKYNNGIYYDRVNNLYGFNTKQPNSQVEINSSTGNVLKLTYNGNTTPSSKFDVLSTGQLNLTTGTFNITSDYSTYGLKLNNTLITNTATVLNTLSNTIAGIARPLSLLVTDSSNNISNINTISCNSLIVNGSSINASANNNYFKDTILGTALDSKALMTDNSNDISNINCLGTNNIKINSNYIGNTNNSLNHNLSYYNNVINKEHMDYYKSIFNDTVKTYTLSSNALYSDVIWVSNYKMFIAIMFVNYTTSNRIAISYDGINWIENTNLILYNVSFTCMAYSEELNVVVAINSNNTNYRTFMSNDGLNWRPSSYNEVNNYSWKSVTWSPELNLFVAVSDDSTGRIMVSPSGENWTILNQSSTSPFNCISWSNKLNLFVAITNSVSNPYYISTDGMSWTNSGISYSGISSALRSICWSQELGMFCAIGGDRFVQYSYNGYTWFNQLLPFYATIVIKWISDLNIFIMPSSGSQAIAYSNNGIDWYVGTTTFVRTDALAWSTDLKKIVMLQYSGTTAYITKTIFPNSSLNSVLNHSNNLIIDKTNGYMGIGINPSYQLELSTDSAAKPTSSAWTVGSDIRLKENIENANLDICYDNFKKINLVKYKWKDNIYNNTEINDRNQLGWIAQDVELIYPKSVTEINKFNINNCKQLNPDQLFTMLYGSVQKLINNYEEQENELNNLNNEITNIDNFIKNLEISN